MPDDEEWRILAEEAAQEQDPKKLMEIIDSLTVALYKQQNKNRGGATPMPLRKANSGPKVIQSSALKNSVQH
ncbi:MAG: hypothetical protein JWN74_493 [Acidobacteriaceae bacterium]|nr:hypothetical protein [Acidobacteriaceae bacterium]